MTSAGQGRPRREDVDPHVDSTAASLEELAQQLDAPRSVWLMVPAGIVDAVVKELAPHLERGRHDRRRRQLVLRATTCAGRRSWRERGHPLRRRRRQRRRLGPRARLLPDGRRRRRGGRAAAAGPRGARARGRCRERTPGREGDPAPEEQGWLHCGPNGAGHFVKMVHNGIEYGLMQAYAEGLNVLKHANVGMHDQETDAETTPLRDPDHYRYELDLAAVAELWRRGSVVSLLAARPDRTGAARVAEPRRLRRPRERLRRGPLDGAGRSRRGRAGAGARGLALRPLRLARRGRVRQPRPLRHAAGLRRAPGEGRRAMTETEPRAREPAARRARAAAARPIPCALVIFGASGDLTRRKLFPALYSLALRRLLPEQFAVVGVARSEETDDEFRERMKEAVQEFGRDEFDEEVWEWLADGMRYVATDFADEGGEDRLAAVLTELDEERGTAGNRVYYLAVPPDAISTLVRRDSASAARPSGWTRVIVEKPFGRDLASAAGAERGGSSATSTRRRSSGSTTTSARRRSRTCSRCASRTGSSSRSGTASSSTTSRSPSPSRSGSRAAPPSTNRRARSATSSRTTCCSWSR